MTILEKCANETPGSLLKKKKAKHFSKVCCSYLRHTYEISSNYKCGFS